MAIHKEPKNEIPALSLDEINFVKIWWTVFQSFNQSGILPDSSNLSLPSEDLTAVDLAAYLAISLKTVYLRAAKNSSHPFPFKTYRTGRKLRFRRSEVDECYLKGVI